MAKKGVDAYTFLSNPAFEMDFTVPGDIRRFTNPNTLEYANLLVDSSNIGGVTNYIGPFTWSALEQSLVVASRTNQINTLTGHLADGSEMTNMMNMPSIINSSHMISYGFYDAGSGLGGLTDQDQSYAYITDSYADWMVRLTASFPDAAKKPFHQFCLPGVHDAGMNTMTTAYELVDSPLIKILLKVLADWIPALGDLVERQIPIAIQNLAITQKDPFKTMLDLGIRYFDFRPGYMFPLLNGFSDELYHQHSVIPGAKYQDFLVEILEWLRDHPTEVIVVSCNTQGFLSEAMSPTSKVLDEILEAARTTAGVSEATVNTGDKDSLNLSLEELQTSKTQLIFLNQIEGETTKYDSYNDDYATLNVDPIIAALDGMTESGQADATYTVLQIQGTASGVPSVIPQAILSPSETSSPLMSTKANFDRATLPWLTENVNANLSSDYLTIALNDFGDNATVNTCIEVTKQRMGL